MRSLREVIRSIIQDDALYRRLDLPGDIDDPEEEECGCGCEKCQKEDEDFITPKYALYSLIGDAIQMYDSMEDDSMGDEETNQLIFSIASTIRDMKN